MLFSGRYRMIIFDDVMKKIAIALLFLIPTLTYADLHKCMKDGSVSYQQAPCDKGSEAVKSEVGNDNPLLGCFKPLHPAEPYEAYEIRSKLQSKTRQVYDDEDNVRHVAGDVPEIRLLRTDKPEWQGSVLRAATSQEVQATNQATHMHLVRGLVFVNQRTRYYSDDNAAKGVYMGRDANNDPVYFLDFEQSSSAAKKVDCH